MSMSKIDSRIIWELEHLMLDLLGLILIISQPGIILSQTTDVYFKYNFR